MAFVSQIGLMVQKCDEEGIPRVVFNNMLELKQKEVQERYGNREYSKEWVAWKAEVTAWDYFSDNAFVRPENFPGTMPQLQLQAGAVVSPTKSSPTLSTVSYNSQLELMRAKAKAMGIDMILFENTLREKSRISEARFGTMESQDWRKWFAECSVWGCLFKNSPFPGSEPPRKYPLRSTQEDTVHKYSGLSGDKWAKTPFPADSPRREEPGVGNLTGPGPPTAPREMRDQVPTRPVSQHTLRVQAPQNPDPSEYIPLENLMERKAKALGLRREFFQYLQRKRDFARRTHGNCSSQYRHWMADSLVWAKFFERDPFPGREPKGAGVHSNACAIAIQSKSEVGIAQESRVKHHPHFTEEKHPINLKHSPTAIEGESRPIREPEVKHEPRSLAETYKQADVSRVKFRYRGEETSFDCSDAAVGDLAFVIAVDDRKAEVEESLGYCLRVFERFRDIGRGLQFKVEALSQHPDPHAEDRAINFMISFVRQGIRRNPEKMSKYWQSWNTNQPLGISKLSATNRSRVKQEQSPSDKGKRKLEFGKGEVSEKRVRL